MPRSRFRTSDDDYEPDTELDPTSATGERLASAEIPNDPAAADYEAARWEDAFWGPGL